MTLAAVHETDVAPLPLWQARSEMSLGSASTSEQESLHSERAEHPLVSESAFPRVLARDSIRIGGWCADDCLTSLRSALADAAPGDPSVKIGVIDGLPD